MYFRIDRLEERDLSPANYFLWVCIKTKFNLIGQIPLLKEMIREEITATQPYTLQNVCSQFQSQINIKIIPVCVSTCSHDDNKVDAFYDEIFQCISEDKKTHNRYK